ncbi:DNA translocase FtsK 4TM domain-containing protein, partial [Sphingopyxis sp.]|uniref:DNA translocase FtsK 4TM domain-containing protein n=1 Tax=Sphingopyxis sp. TaxID=1908224 RepID=UPI002B459288
MASRKAAPAKADWRTVFRQSIARSLVIAAAVALGLFTLFLTLALVTYDSTDAALNTAAHGTAANWMGGAGAWFADLGLSIGGAPIVLLLPLLGVIAWRLWTGEAQPYWPRQLAYSFIGILLVGLGAELWSPATNAPMPAGWGGIIALLIGGAVAPLFAQAGEPAAALIRFATILLLVGLGLWLAWRALRLEKGWASRFKLPAAEGSSRVIEPA